MWAPSSRRPFRSSLPGAVIALASWLTLSSALGLYLRNFGRLNKTYGTLAAAVALMAWLYWTAFAILVCAASQFGDDTPAGNWHFAEGTIGIASSYGGIVF